RVDVLAAAYHHVVPTPGQPQVALVVERAEVARTQPAILTTHPQVSRRGEHFPYAFVVRAVDTQSQAGDRAPHRGEQPVLAGRGTLVVGGGKAGDRAALGL